MSWASIVKKNLDDSPDSIKKNVLRKPTQDKPVQEVKAEASEVDGVLGSVLDKCVHLVVDAGAVIRGVRLERLAEVSEMSLISLILYFIFYELSFPSFFFFTVPVILNRNKII